MSAAPDPNAAPDPDPAPDLKAAAAQARWSLAALVPLILFSLLGVVFAVQLFSDDVEPTSPLIGKPAPAFSAPNLIDMRETVTEAALIASPEEGGVTVLNIWASWCGPCRIEHPDLMRLAERGDVKMVGVAYRDKPPDSVRFLAQLGDPFDTVIVDAQGRIALSFGVTGVPETFIIDGEGRVTHRHAGAILNDDLAQKILPAIERAR